MSLALPLMKDLHPDLRAQLENSDNARKKEHRMALNGDYHRKGVEESRSNADGPPKRFRRNTVYVPFVDNTKKKRDSAINAKSGPARLTQAPGQVLPLMVDWPEVKALGIEQLPHEHWRRHSLLHSTLKPPSSSLPQIDATNVMSRDFRKSVGISSSWSRPVLPSRGGSRGLLGSGRSRLTQSRGRLGSSQSGEGRFGALGATIRPGGGACIVADATGFSEEEGMRIVADAIAALRRNPKLITTEEVADQLELDGWTKEEVEELIEISQRKMKDLSQKRRMRIKELMSLERVSSGYQPTPDEPLPQDELPIYLKEHLGTLPVAVCVPSSSSGACKIQMHFPDTTNAMKAVDILCKRIKSTDALRSCRALREGHFVEVTIEQCKIRQNIDDLIHAIRDASALKSTRRVEL